MKKTKTATKPKKAAKVEESDLDPEAWSKFEKLIKNAAKLGHKPHKK